MKQRLEYRSKYDEKIHHCKAQNHCQFKTYPLGPFLKLLLIQAFLRIEFLCGEVLRKLLALWIDLKLDSLPFCRSTLSTTSLSLPNIYA